MWESQCGIYILTAVRLRIKSRYVLLSKSCSVKYGLENLIFQFCYKNKIPPDLTLMHWTWNSLTAFAIVHTYCLLEHVHNWCLGILDIAFKKNICESARINYFFCKMNKIFKQQFLIDILSTTITIFFTDGGCYWVSVWSMDSLLYQAFYWISRRSLECFLNVANSKNPTAV